MSRPPLVVYVCVRVGRWMLRNGGLYHLRPHHAARNPHVTWQSWDRVRLLPRLKRAR